ALGRVDLDELDVLLIECSTAASSLPVLGESAASVRVVSVTEDLALTPPPSPGVARPDLLLFTKFDLLPFLPLDAAAFCDRVMRDDPGLHTIATSAVTGQGLGEWYQWIHDRVEGCRANRRSDGRTNCSEYFVG